MADAIGRNDMADLQDELGDLLFQAVFHAQMAAEAGEFGFADVTRSIADKMERRHPHVFGEERVASVEAQSAAWEDFKARERVEKSQQGGDSASVLDDVPAALPALLRAHKLGRRMARVGLDWPDALSITGKVAEELGELRDEIERGDAAGAAEELGDLLFTVAQVGRRLGIDPGGSPAPGPTARSSAASVPSKTGCAWTAAISRRCPWTNWNATGTRPRPGNRRFGRPVPR